MRLSDERVAAVLREEVERHQTNGMPRLGAISHLYYTLTEPRGGYEVQERERIVKRLEEAWRGVPHDAKYLRVKERSAPAVRGDEGR